MPRNDGETGDEDLYINLPTGTLEEEDIIDEKMLGNKRVDNSRSRISIILIIIIIIAVIVMNVIREKSIHN